jgi:hypothetical protein
MGRDLTVAGLIADLVGVMLLAVAAAIRYRAGLSRGLRAPTQPTGGRAAVVKWCEWLGWPLLVGGFALQLVGAW